MENGNKINTRGVHKRNIRAIFNLAIADKVISADLYPFKAYIIEKEETDKRTLTIEEFRKLMEFCGTPQENWAKDVFLLSFFMLGINMKDLFYLEDIENEQIKYRRAKTNKLFHVKLEPEAVEIINRHKGESLLLNFSDTIEHHENFTRKVNAYLEKVAVKINKKEVEKEAEAARNGKKITHKFRMRIFTTYAARHSWATFAAELDIPEKTISMGLGHESKGNATTSIYIKFNHNKVIDANRKVIDYVHGKIELPPMGV